MKYCRLLFLVAVVILLVGTGGKVFADSTNFDAYPVDSEGSYNKKDTFGWDETPWIYVSLPGTDLTYVVSWWHYQDGTEYYSTYSITDDTDEVWHTLSNWDDVKAPGKWDVRVDYSSASGNGSKTTGFSVAPEPFGFVLFIFGGVVLALVKRK